MDQKPEQCPYCKIKFTGKWDCSGRSWPKVICWNCRYRHEALKQQKAEEIQQLLCDAFKMIPFKWDDNKFDWMDDRYYWKSKTTKKMVKLLKEKLISRNGNDPAG